MIDKQKIKDIKLFSFNSFKDSRGNFSRIFCKNLIKKKTNDISIKQINHSFTKNIHTLRGMHFQKKPKQEGKYMYVLTGKIQLVVVDIRPRSKTYKSYDSFILENNKTEKKIIYIPKGCANGFLTLTKNVNIIYMMTNYFDDKQNFGFRYDDENIAIKWKYKPKLVSDKDKNLPIFYKR